MNFPTNNNSNTSTNTNNSTNSNNNNIYDVSVNYLVIALCIAAVVDKK